MYESPRGALHDKALPLLKGERVTLVLGLPQQEGYPIYCSSSFFFTQRIYKAGRVT